jgi:hypothetical protein
MQQNGKTDDSAKVSNKEETVANHQIANLLLNLASRSQQQHMRAEPEAGPEPEAMDLSKYRKPKEASGTGSKAPNSSYYSGMAGLGSPFLLQNLLMQQMSPAAVVGQAGVATTIPLMAGQIVAQLNSLLFAVHGVQDKGVELNVQGQLGAIYTRLQEIVTMIQHAKKRDPARSVKAKEEAPPSQLELHKQLELVTSTKEAEEQRIGHQLEEYQRALAGTTTASMFPQFPPASPLSSSVASLLRKQPKPPPAPEAEGPDPTEAQAGPEEPLASRRGSRDSLEDSPPEKRARMAEDTRAGSPASPPSGSRGSGSRSGKGGKGIRNRVFCGDCAGCLKNDDCGSCRYCR